MAMALSFLRTDVLATRGGYPAWILWGNCLWAAVAVRRNPAWPGWPSRISPLFSILYSYVALAYPGNFSGNWLMLGRVPSAISSPIIFPTHLASWLLVHFFPFDLVYKLLAMELPYRLLDAVAALDNMTTALGYMEYAAEVSVAAGRHCLMHSILGGMASAPTSPTPPHPTSLHGSANRTCTAGPPDHLCVRAQ